MKDCVTRRWGMNKNMGSADRAIRVLIAVLLGVLIFAKQIVEVTAIVLGILAIVFLLTSTVGFCPLYVPMKFSTRKKS
jgi:hypothetical protein